MDGQLDWIDGSLGVIPCVPSVYASVHLVLSGAREDDGDERDDGNFDSHLCPLVAEMQSESAWLASPNRYCTVVVEGVRRERVNRSYFTVPHVSTCPHVHLSTLAEGATVTRKMQETVD